MHLLGLLRYFVSFCQFFVSLVVSFRSSNDDILASISYEGKNDIFIILHDIKDHTKTCDVQVLGCTKEITIYGYTLRNM